VAVVVTARVIRMPARPDAAQPRRPRAWQCAARAAGLALVLAVLWAAGAGARAQHATPSLPVLTEPVHDLAGVVDPASRAAIERTIRALQSATGDVIVVVTVPTVAPYPDIRDYAVELFENHGRGIGEKGKDNGLLVVLAVDDRRVWIEVGYGLEPIITDGFAGETSRRFMVPAFREGRYGEGLLAGVQRIAGRIAEERGATLEGVSPPPRPRARADRATVTAFVLFLIVVLLLSGGMTRRAGPWGRRRGYGAWWGGPWSGWGGGGFGGGWTGGGLGGGFGGFGGGRSGGGGGGASW
jgi:uncharacterized protein